LYRILYFTCFVNFILFHLIFKKWSIYGRENNLYTQTEECAAISGQKQQVQRERTIVDTDGYIIQNKLTYEDLIREIWRA
jgi:hypothetical protein